MHSETGRRLLIGERLHIVVATGAGLLFAILMGLFAVGQSGNPIKALMQVLGGVLLIVGTLRPRVGLHFLILSSACLDFFKRLMVAFGLGGMSDVMGVLAVAPLVLLGIFLGACVLYPIFTKKMLQKDERHLVYGALFPIGISLAVGYRQATSLAELFGTAANQAAYALLVPIVYVLYRHRGIDDLKKLLRFTAFVYAPVALYGVFQYWFGLNQFEIDYLTSGLTITVVNLYDIHPRPFSTLNSPHSFSTIMWFMVVVSGYLAFHGGSRFRCPRWLPFVFAGSLVLSLVRGAIIQTVANLAMGRWFRTRKGTLVFYTVAFGTMAALIAFSQPILDNLENMQSVLPFDQDWQQQAFRLGTLADRLQGYQSVLLNPRMYTLFGHGLSTWGMDLKFEEEGFNHDSLSELLFRFGLVGVAVFATVALFVLWRIHSAVWRTKDPECRTFAAMLVSIVVLITLSHIGGPSFHVFPINVFIWLFLGMAWTVCFGVSKSAPSSLIAANVNPSANRIRLPEERQYRHETNGVATRERVSRTSRKTS